MCMRCSGFDDGQCSKVFATQSGVSFRFSRHETLLAAGLDSTPFSLEVIDIPKDGEQSQRKLKDQGGFIDNLHRSVKIAHALQTGLKNKHS